MTSDEEKKLLRAYNIGYMLSTYEPRLLEQIIKNNKNHEFVKTMAIARDHQEFERGIPRKDFTREYKNGFSNARSLAANDPKLLNRLLSTDTLNKEYLKGLKSGKVEHRIKKAKEKLQSIPKPVPPKYKNDFKRGFNEGYRLSQYYPDIIHLAVDTQKRWSPYIQGLQAGTRQLSVDVEKGLQRGNKSELSDIKYNNTRIKVQSLKENAEDKLDILNSPEKQKESQPQPPTAEKDNIITNYMPSWLTKDHFEQDNDEQTPEKEDLDRDTEPDR